ncbi:hypothetical protein ABVK25_005070 [Lepraria finkii]|uniref:Uncharacterized protein n=1 Tax=Lepraria finkii TaxID=1340010 RepID=A0ABR4BD34_9LECA
MAPGWPQNQFFTLWTSCAAADGRDSSWEYRIEAQSLLYSNNAICNSSSTRARSGRGSSRKFPIIQIFGVYTTRSLTEVIEPFLELRDSFCKDIISRMLAEPNLLKIRKSPSDARTREHVLLPGTSTASTVDPLSKVRGVL